MLLILLPVNYCGSYDYVELNETLMHMLSLWILFVY
jgi:hypothetical protein